MSDEKIYKKIGKKIKKLRKQTGLTQEQFGMPAGIKQSAVANLEAGRVGISIVSIYKIVRANNLCDEAGIIFSD